MTDLAFRRRACISCLVSLALFASLSYCSKTQKAPVLPSLSDFRWGEDPKLTAKHFTEFGWKNKLRIDNQLQLVVPIDEKTRAALSENFGSDIPENYTMTLFSQNGRLLIAKIYRQKTTREMETWLSQIKKSLNLSKRIWQSKVLSERLSTDAEIQDKSAIYDAGNVFAVVHTSRNEVRGSLPAKGKQIRLEDGANMEVEIRLYHKRGNEGLTKEALIRQVSQKSEK